MRKLLMTAVMAVAFVAPAKADTQFTPQNIAKVAVAMTGYDLKCGGLPPKTKQLLNVISIGVDRSTATAEIMNVLTAMNEVGLDKWCGNMRGPINEMERQ
jgi:hypothetical protein